MVARCTFLGICCALLMSVGCCGHRGMGCGSACGDCCDGRSYAGQIFNTPGTPHIPFGICKGPKCCDTGCEPGCGCEPACGVEPGCGCEPACGVGPSCGIEPGCQCEPGCGCTSGGRGIGLFGEGGLFGCLFGNTGCSGEIYWDEWHNDPPRCCDPCNRCGQWVGPAATSGAPTCNCR